jgi:hypothetical protein
VSPDEWIALGEEKIVEVLHAHTAVTVRELEARVSNSDWPHYGGVRIDPDFLSKARRGLEDAGTVVSSTRRTRGAHQVTTYHLGGLRNMTLVGDVSARKRLLTARHAGWSEATRRRRKGLIGEAGERAFVNLLEGSDLHGSIRRDAASVLGHTIRGGTLDTVSYFTIEDNLRPRAFTVVTEMKNQREWPYATNPELHKFLYKVANLSTTTGNLDILPVFISPFRSSQAFELGRLFGFFAVRSEHQWVLDRTPLTTDGFNEVRDELGYQDLRLGEEPTIRFTRAMTESLKRNASVVAQRWVATAAECEDLFNVARNSRDSREIGNLVEEARRRVDCVIGQPPGYQPITGPRS